MAIDTSLAGADEGAGVIAGVGVVLVASTAESAEEEKVMELDEDATEPECEPAPKAGNSSAEVMLGVTAAGVVRM